MHCIQALCCCIICAKNMILDLDISLWARAVSEKNARTCTSCTVAARSTCKAIPKDSQTLFKSRHFQHRHKNIQRETAKKKLDQVSECFWI